jgi:hypothetical protein
MPASGLFSMTLTNLHSADVANGDLDDVVLYNADLETLASIQGSNIAPGTSSTSSLVLVHEEAIYYIKVKALQPSDDAAHSAPYALQTTLEAISIADLAEPNDRQQDAHPVSVDTSFSAQIGYGQDRTDWYQFQPAADGTITIEITNLHPLGQRSAGMGESTVFDTALRQITQIENQVLNAQESKVKQIAVTAGETYYLVVGAVISQAAPYQSTITFTEAPN